MIGFIWKKITNTKAVENCSGKFEKAFFETVYRVSYLAVYEGIPYLIYSFIVKLLLFLLFCGEVYYCFFETVSLDESAESINLIVLQVITIYRYGKMISHVDVFKKLASAMNSPYFENMTEERKRIVEYWAKRNANYLKLLLFLGNGTLAIWFLYPLVDELEYNLFIGITLPFNYRRRIVYPFSYLLVAAPFYYIAHFVMVNILLMQAHLLHLVCQFVVLSDSFENILKDCHSEFIGIDENTIIKNHGFRERIRTILGEMVDQHRSILDHVNFMRSILSGPMLGQLAASGTLICFIGYQVTTTGAENIAKCLMCLFFLAYNLFEFYIICRWCKEITTQSLRVGEAAYCSNWECGLTEVKGVKNCLLLVITRASKPLVLTAGGMYDLSLVSFTSLVKASYSALTVLLQFRQS